jgi:hypothetical protein
VAAPFITVQDVSDLLGRDLTTDDGATIAIEAACDICRTESGQLFTTLTETITLDGTGTDAILLPERPANTAGTVLVNGTAEANYRLNGNGVLLRGTAGSDPRPVWPAGRQNITVTYSHGYGTVPADVRMVALQSASRMVIQGAATEEQIGDVRVKYAAPAADLTPGELRILGRYRQIR